MEKWFIKNKRGDYKKIASDFKISEVLSKILVNREILDYKLIDSFINPKLSKLHDPCLMKDLQKASLLLKEDIINKNRIRIVGDFDVDGIMSVYILYTSLKNLGANVDYVIPDRVNDGYGINNQIVNKAKEDGVNTILTCDNGIAAIDQIKLAKEVGLKIIITDHHDQPFIIDEESGEKNYLDTEADAVVNPKQRSCKYPFKLLCGAAISYKLIENLYKLFERDPLETYQLLEYVAIATICDVVDLIDENRILVKEGLKLVNISKNKGLRALIAESAIEGKDIGVYHIGFIIGPSLNATGRLESANLALDLLLSKDQEEAKILAKKLRDLNEERKAITTNGVNKAIKIVENTSIKDDKILVIYEPEINESVAGIIAGRIKEKYNKPTIVLTDGNEGAKGSARSIEEYNIYEELSRFKDLFQRFGGHPMAAGLSLDKENIDLLRLNLNKTTSLVDEDLVAKVYIDMPMPVDYVSFNIINELSSLEPFGKGNSKPIFGDRTLKIRQAYKLGKNKNVLKFNFISTNNMYAEGIYFGNIQEFEENLIKNYGNDQLDKIYKGISNKVLIDIIYYPSINEYNGSRSIQLVIQNYRFESNN